MLNSLIGSWKRTVYEYSSTLVLQTVSPETQTPNPAHNLLKRVLGMLKMWQALVNTTLMLKEYTIKVTVQVGGETEEECDSGLELTMDRLTNVYEITHEEVVERDEVEHE